VRLSSRNTRPSAPFYNEHPSADAPNKVLCRYGTSRLRRVSYRFETNVLVKIAVSRLAPTINIFPKPALIPKYNALHNPLVFIFIAVSSSI
jgi:hypothetical protein